MHLSKPRFCLFSLLALIGPSSLLLAQAAAPAPESPRGAKDEETVVLNVGANVRGDRVIGYNTVTGAPFWAGGYVQYNASVGYGRQLQFAGRKLKWSVTLAGTNIGGHRYGLIPSAGDNLGITRYFFETTPTAFLTNKFSF